MNQLDSILFALAILIITTISTVGTSRSILDNNIVQNQQIVDWQQWQNDQQTFGETTTPTTPKSKENYQGMSSETQEALFVTAIVITSLLGVGALLLVILWILLSHSTLLNSLLEDQPQYTTGVIYQRYPSQHPDYVDDDDD